MNNNKKLEKLKLVDYRKICQVKDFSHYNKGVLPNNSIYIVKDPEEINLIPPLNSFPEKKIPNESITNEFYIASIKNALCLQNQTILHKNKFILPDSFRHYGFISTHRALHYDVASKSFNSNEKLDKITWQPGDSIFLSGEFSESYGHFLLEVVSRLWISQFIDIRQYKFIMNPTDRHRWQLDILKALGINPNQILYLHHPTRCERLHIPVQSFVLRKYTSTLAYNTWKKIGDYYDMGVGPDKIYVSRSKLKNNRRRLLNEKEVEKVLSSHGFSIIHPQELSIRNQVNLFRNARIIVGPSGSAMYNCVFQKKHTKKLILAPPKFLKISDVLINTSTKGQLNYFVGTTVDHNTPAIRADWLVNIDKFKKYLNEFLENSP